MYHAKGDNQHQLPDPQLPIIIGHDIHKHFQVGDQWVHALDGVSLEVPRGQFLSVMGPSGSGKSTLLYLLGGLDQPDEGQIFVADRQLDTMNRDELAAFRRQTVGFIFQAFHLIPNMTAVENVALAGIFSGLAKEVRDQRAAQLLIKVGLADRLDHRPTQLSGGQQQRVAIARALFNNPAIIVGDEPTGALDSKTGTIVFQLLRKLSERQKTIVVVSHDPAVEQYSDRIMHMRDGRIVTDEVINREALPNRLSAEHVDEPFNAKTE